MSTPYQIQLLRLDANGQNPVTLETYLSYVEGSWNSLYVDEPGPGTWFYKLVVSQSGRVGKTTIVAMNMRR